MDENLRFIAVLDGLKARGLISGYVAVAEQLGTNKAAISDIKGCRKRLSLDLLRSLKSSYPEINLNWVIMGEGEMFLNANPSEKSADTLGSSLVTMIKEKDLLIQDQAKEIGRLEERNAQLQHRNSELETELSRGLQSQTDSREFTPHYESQKV